MTNSLKLKTCFQEAFALPDISSVEQMSYQKHKSWDSVGHMRLVANIESTFNIMFTTDQILDMNSFEKARDILGLHGIDLDH